MEALTHKFVNLIMKQLVSILILCVAWITGFTQQWTPEQLQKANTAIDEYMLSDTEKEVIQYINLCRLYPAEFAEKELKNYAGVPGVQDKNFSTYKASLAKDLKSRPACSVLMPDELLYDDAKCYGNEVSKNKIKPHQRLHCIKRNYAECIYYGRGEAKHIAMQWLIDSGIESLGHRKICLQPAYKKIGIKVNPHFEFSNCAVAEFDR